MVTSWHGTIPALLTLYESTPHPPPFTHTHTNTHTHTHTHTHKGSVMPIFDVSFNRCRTSCWTNGRVPGDLLWSSCDVTVMSSYPYPTAARRLIKYVLSESILLHHSAKSSPIIHAQLSVIVMLSLQRLSLLKWVEPVHVAGSTKFTRGKLTAYWF